MTMPENKLTHDGVDMNRVQRIIGIEFTYIDYARGNVREEIMMLIPPNGHFDVPYQSEYGYSNARSIQVTLHTSHGDRVAVISL